MKENHPRALFCNIAYMKYYRGITDEDKPRNGGSYVENEGKAYEEYNFLEDRNGIIRGFVETKYHKGYKDPEHIPNKMHIEKIDNHYKNKESIDDVLVIFTATGDQGRVIVGWYENATVFRNRQPYVIDDEQWEYNILAESKNCRLIREGRRDFPIPQARIGSFGMGQSNVRYVQTDEDYVFLEKVIDYLDSMK